MKSQNRQISAYRPYPNPRRFLAVSLLLILCLGVFLAPPAFACHKDKPHGPDTCDGDGDGGGDETPPLASATMASFIGPDGVDEDSPADCIPGALATGAGQFDCASGQLVRITTAGMSMQSSKRDANLCKSFNVFSQNTTISNVQAASPMKADIYQYGWTDDCTDGACQIVVDVSFSGADIIAATGGKSDAVDLQISGTLSGNFADDANPFNTEQTLAMGFISAQFRKPGSTTVAASCGWYPGSVEIGNHKSVVFTSVPNR